MTTKEKARAYDEALKDMRAIYPNLKGDAKLAVEHAFPELAESEDERIRKEIRNFLIDMGCKEEWIIYLEKQKEQKPIQTEYEKEYVRTLKSLIVDFLRGKEEVDRPYYQKIYDWLDGRHIEQKPEERFEEAREKYQVVWSEEDENALKYLHELISFGYTEKFFDAQTAADMREWLNTRLKSLRPSWKPSEEQMEALRRAVNKLAKSDVADSVRLSIMYDNLKKLM